MRDQGSRIRRFSIVLLVASLLILPSLPGIIPPTFATGQEHTLYMGGLVGTPLSSMDDLNSGNVGVTTFNSVLGYFPSISFIYPYYYFPLNDSFRGLAATSYKVFRENDTYIVHVRNDTGWNNGQPVTAWDLYATGIWIAGLGAPAYNYKVLNNWTLSVQAPTNPKYGLYGLSVSSFAFGPDLAASPVVINYNQWAPEIKEILGNYSGLQAGNGTVLARVRDSIFNFKTPQALFSGGYYPTAVSSSEIVMSKNPYYFAAKTLAVDKIVVYQFTSPNTMFQYLVGGQLSILGSNYNFFGGAGLDVPDSYKSSLPSYVKDVSPTAYGGPAILFNNATGFVSNVHVRKAIAYALNRTELALAGGSSYSAVKLPIGMPSWMYPSMCPASCQAQMSPYSLNLTAAADEMKSAGYTLQSGAWTNKNGTQVKLTLLNSDGSPAWLGISLDIQTQLQAFGISVDTLSPINWYNYAISGKGFDLWLGQWAYWVTPYDIYRWLEMASGYPGRMLSFDKNVTVPMNNLGSINPVYEARRILSSKTVAEEAKIAQGLAWLVNHYLPYLPLENQVPLIYVNAQQFNWPDSSSDIWTTFLAYDLGTPIMLALETGQLTLKNAATTTSSLSATTTAAISTSTVTETSISTSTSVSTGTVTSTSVITSTATSVPFLGLTTLVAVGAVALIAIVAAVTILRRRPPTSSNSPGSQPR